MQPQDLVVTRCRPPGRVISVPETEPHCSEATFAFINAIFDAVISVPETEPHCSRMNGSAGMYQSSVISVPETEPHCSWAVRVGDARLIIGPVISVPETEPHCSMRLTRRSRIAAGCL